MAFEKLKKTKAQILIGRTKKLWEAGYNSMQIAEKIHQPVERVQEWIKLIVAAEKVTE